MQFAKALKKTGIRSIAAPIVTPARKGKIPIPSLRYLAIAASIIVVSGLGFGIWKAFFNESPVEKGLIALQEAYREGRPLQTRLSDFAYAPLANERGESSKVDSLKQDLAARLLLSEANDDPNAQSHHAAGQYYLYERQFSKAIDELNKALKFDPNNAKIHSDLGAAFLEDGKTHSVKSSDGAGVKQFAEALSHLNKALGLDATNREALFNRALLYEYLGLASEAEADWRRYIQLDPNSKWTEEAQQNLKVVQEKLKTTSRTGEGVFQDFIESYQARNDEKSWRLLSGYHNRSGNVIVEHLLDVYLDLHAKGQQEEAKRHLEVLSYAASLTKQKTGDRFFSDVAIFYGLSNAERRKTLSKGRLLLKQGHQGWGQISDDDNLKLFIRAKELFDKAGAKCESLVADYWVALAYHRGHNNKDSLLVLEPLISISQEANYRQLLARCLYLLAGINFNRNEHSRAVVFARQSLELAEEINDTVGTINALTSLIEYFRYLKNYDESLKYIERSLPLVSSISMDPVQGSRHFGFEATAFAAAGLPDAARDFQKEALRFALNTGNKSVISYNYAFLAMVNCKLGNVDQALKDTQVAYEVAQELSKEASGRELMAYALLQRGHIFRQMRNFDNAIASYNESIDRYEHLNHPTNLFQAYKGRFVCYVAQKKDSFAKADLATTLKLAEEYRDKIPEETLRGTFFDAEQNLYDAAIDFEYSRLNEHQESFRISELSHARTLLDLIQYDREVLTRGLEPEIISASVASPLSPDQVLSQLPKGAQIVQYGVLEQKLIIWVVSKGKISGVPSDISETDLTTKVRSYLNLASSPSSSDSDELRRLSEELYETLVEPIRSQLEPNNQICIVPDKILNYLPFGALISPSSGKYLLEDYRLLISPSSTIFIASSQIAREKRKSVEERLLSVGNPRFSRKIFPSFPDLPSAADEARQIADYYKSPKSLIGNQAKVETVEFEITEADVVHLALHSALDERFPLRSKLLLASQDGRQGSDDASDGVWFAYKIYGLKLPRTRLAVLSACATGAERYYGGEGMISLARPFIAARVPLVVASLWPVDSNFTKELMVSFQRLRKIDHLSTIDALRNAQIAMLKDSGGRRRPPYYWAPFVVIGGYADF